MLLGLIYLKLGLDESLVRPNHVNRLWAPNGRKTQMDPNLKLYFRK